MRIGQVTPVFDVLINMKAHLTLIAAIIATILNVQAKEDAGRLELKTAEGASIEVIEVGNGAKIANQSGGSVTIDQVVTGGEWTSASIKFKTTADTEVRLRLSARYTQMDDMWVFIDNVKAVGAEVQNPDFEEGSGTAAPSGWKFIKSPSGGLATRVSDPSKAASGESFVRVSHGSPVIQTVHIPKDTEVTISFSARSAGQ